MQFIWPTNTHTIGDGFHARNGEHQGIDLLANNGSTVEAAANGVITYQGLAGGYGNLIIITHANGYTTRYGHLSHFALPTGSAVRQGETIALSGGIKGAPGSGDSTGPHLHFEIRLNNTALDPVPYLNGTIHPPVPTPIHGWTNIRKGSRGAMVLAVQKFFNRVFPAYSHLVPDGIDGKQTSAVIGEFQRRVGIPDDEIIGPQTLTYMREYGFTA